MLLHYKAHSPICPSHTHTHTLIQPILVYTMLQATQSLFSVTHIHTPMDTSEAMWDFDMWSRDTGNRLLFPLSNSHPESETTHSMEYRLQQPSKVMETGIYLLYRACSRVTSPPRAGETKVKEGKWEGAKQVFLERLETP